MSYSLHVSKVPIIAPLLSLLKSGDVTHADVVIAGVLLSHCAEDAVDFWPSKTRIANLVGSSPIQVRKSIQTLIDLSILSPSGQVGVKFIYSLGSRLIESGDWRTGHSTPAFLLHTLQQKKMTYSSFIMVGLFGGSLTYRGVMYPSITAISRIMGSSPQYLYKGIKAACAAGYLRKIVAVDSVTDSTGYILVDASVEPKQSPSSTAEGGARESEEEVQKEMATTLSTLIGEEAATIFNLWVRDPWVVVATSQRSHVLAAGVKIRGLIVSRGFDALYSDVKNLRNLCITYPRDGVSSKFLPGWKKFWAVESGRYSIDAPISVWLSLMDHNNPNVPKVLPDGRVIFDQQAAEKAMEVATQSPADQLMTILKSAKEEAISYSDLAEKVNRTGIDKEKALAVKTKIRQALWDLSEQLGKGQVSLYMPLRWSNEFLKTDAMRALGIKEQVL